LNEITLLAAVGPAAVRHAALIVADITEAGTQAEAFGDNIVAKAPADTARP